MCVALQSQVLFSGVVAGMGVGAVGVDGAVVVQLNQFVPKCSIGIFQKSCVLPMSNIPIVSLN